LIKGFVVEALPPLFGFFIFKPPDQYTNAFRAKLAPPLDLLLTAAKVAIQVYLSLRLRHALAPPAENQNACASGHDGYTASGWAARTGMRKIRQLLLATLMACAFPLAVYGQWASNYKEHDWRLTISGNSYGLVQDITDWGLGPIRATTICVGPHTLSTRFPAVYIVAALTLLPMGVFLLTSPPNRRREP
jgi:hypothetical protein